MSIDALDKKIIGELLEDSSLSTGALAKKTGIAQTTIHYRLKKMKDSGVIRKYTLQLDYEKMGLPVMAYILVLFDTITMKNQKLTYEAVADSLKRISEVEEFAYTTGQYDIILRVTAESMRKLSGVILEKLRKIPGVLRTETIMVMNYFER